MRLATFVAVEQWRLSRIPELTYDLLYHERVVRSVPNFTRQDAEEFLRLAAAIPIAGTVMTFPLSATNEALQQLEASSINGAAVLET